MGSITSANAVLTLAIDVLFPVPQQIQGFAADDIYDVASIRSAETQMGVDGVLSGGFVFVPVVQNITLQADSLSNRMFDTWWTQNQAIRDNYVANGVIRLASIASKFISTKGFLTGYTPIPPGKRTLQPRRYEITWERVAPSPI